MNFKILYLLGLLLSLSALADSSIYITHGVNEDSGASTGVELVCIGSGEKLKSCHASRTQNGKVSRTNTVPLKRAAEIIARVSREIQKVPRAKIATCDGALSFSVEWKGKERAETICGESKRDQRLLDALLKAEHAITGTFAP